ncbi:MAG: hypothetical protein HKN23_18220 [Verrucomicrobiales bacterium]|nr:hypothetical protein [Verrucomicrobiales bacterium]
MGAEKRFEWWRGIPVGLLVCSAVLPWHAAYSQEQPTLKELRAEYAAKYESAILPLQASYIKRLETLRDSLEKAEKAEEAARVDLEIRRIKRDVKIEQTRLYSEGKLVIIEATYGAKDRIIDVTEEIKALQNGNSLEVEARPSELKVRDPIFGVRKVLTVLYCYDSGVFTASASDGETIVIPKKNE